MQPNETEFTFCLFSVSQPSKINALEAIHPFILNMLPKMKKLS